MSDHNNLGGRGEELAAEWLIGHGYRIVHRNWRQGRYEVDIIACRKNILHFIEVKTRSSHLFGLPEENISSKKIRNMMKAASAFLYRHPLWKKVQYDVLAISGPAAGKNDLRKDPGTGTRGKPGGGDSNQNNSNRNDTNQNNAGQDQAGQTAAAYEYFFIEDISV
ncbi:MAG: YraN family protein [Puia sp.]|nr:YraN family protein [Puia sp.]